jgi:N-acetylglucosaminyldiphosphoundecaprenol N-acetyl-beta-D-mannosaminyltransferase
LIDLGKQNVLGIQINAIDYEAVVTKIITAAKNHHAMTVSALAVHGIMTGVFNEYQKYRLNNLDLLVPDGQPVRWALNVLYKTTLVERVYGPTLMLKICEKAEIDGLPIYFYGSHSDVLSALISNIMIRYPNIHISGYQPSLFRKVTSFEKAGIIKKILETKPAIVFVGLGCPRQETWIYENRNELQLPLIAVGAAFDFYGETLTQAPDWMQIHGLEWLFRLAQEPKRLWKRYLLFNPLYIILLSLQVLGIKRYDPMHALIPCQDENFG